MDSDTIESSSQSSSDSIETINGNPSEEGME
jgi:hypothetical protein